MSSHPLISEMQASLTPLLELALNPSLNSDPTQFLELLTLHSRAIADLEAALQAELTQSQHLLQQQALLQTLAEQLQAQLSEQQILEIMVQTLGSGLALAGCEAKLYHGQPSNADGQPVHQSGRRTDSQESPDRADLCSDAPAQSDAQAQSESKAIYQSEAQTLSPQDITARRLLILEELSSLIEHSVVAESVQQFCLFQTRQTVLICPIHHQGDELGDLMLYRSLNHPFPTGAILWIQQVASQCASAITHASRRRADLDRLQELKQLHQAQNERLNTIAYQIRPPISNMKVAVQMLRVIVQQVLPPADQDWPELVGEHGLDKICRYLDILDIECDRGTRLIEGLQQTQDPAILYP